MNEKIILKTLTLANKDEFISDLREQLYRRFNVSCDEDLPENYSSKKPWSLLAMIQNDQLDTYQLLFIDGQFWGGTGGVVRTLHDSQKVYQAGFRTFTKAHAVYKGIGMKSFITAYCVRHQIERAKLIDCQNIVISFNLENERLFRILHAYHHKQKFLGISEMMKDFVPSQSPVIFNGVPQWLLEMRLR
jgi:hypothetical protein